MRSFEITNDFKLLFKIGSTVKLELDFKEVSLTEIGDLAIQWIASGLLPE